MGKNAKTVAGRIIGAMILLTVVGFFARVAIFEYTYYAEKEGSERGTAQNEGSGASENLDEVAPTEEEIKKYTVTADKPRYLTIEKLGVHNARILEVGLDANNALATPTNIFDVGWYKDSSLPGEGGTLLMDGHNGGPHVRGVFKELPSLEDGDIVMVERGDGVIFNYSVVENVEISLEESNKYMVTATRSPVAGKESITLISCTGEWSDVQRTYLSRQFVRAVIVE